jgi:hypothetical protein
MTGGSIRALFPHPDQGLDDRIEALDDPESEHLS